MVAEVALATARRRGRKAGGERSVTGPDRWARWAALVADGMTKAEVARSEGVSLAAVTVGLKKLGST